MSKKILIFLFLVLLFSGIKSVRAEDSSDLNTNTDDDEGLTAVASACEYLQEKIQIILPLEAKVSQDFARIHDSYLCRSMSNQCEYFYTLAKVSQKQYRDKCDENYQIVKLDKCDYSANPCVKEGRHLSGYRQAQAENSRRLPLEML